MVHCIHKPKLYDIREFTVKIKIISLLAVSVMLMTALGGCSVDREETENRPLSPKSLLKDATTGFHIRITRLMAEA